MKTIVATVLSFFLTISFLAAQGLQTKQAPLPCLNKKFTIVIHIVKDSLGNTGVNPDQLVNSIDSLNIYFEPICVSFEVCEINIIDNFRYNLLRNENEWAELQVNYHEKNRINMFFVEEIVYLPNACGFAALGGINNLNSSGIVIKKVPACFSPGNTTIPHEMGHYFGLMHTFEGNGIELVNGDNCESAGDLICDTPADPFVPGDSLSLYVDQSLGCRFISPKVDTNGEFYMPHVGNIMSYYPAGCNCGFTYGQYIRMAETCAAGNGDMW